MARTLFSRSLSLTLLFLLFACGPVTKISASKNPGYNGKVFHKLMIEARGMEPQENIQVEWTFRSLFDRMQTPVATATQLFTATGGPDQAVDRQEIFKREGIDGILLVDLKGLHKDTIYHPPTTTETTVHHH